VHASELERFFQLFMGAEGTALAEQLQEALVEARVEHILTVPASELDADDLARELAEQNLNDQKKRYEVGIVTTTDILDFQEKATNAMATEARAIADHATAIAELQRAEGSLLPHYGIRVEFADRPGKEWWSRF
jgi:outer membrane protein TolC